MKITCKRCGQERVHKARGICGYCHEVSSADGTLADYPRLTMTMDEFLADFTTLKARGLTHREIGARIGLKRASVARQVNRARRAGLLT